MKDEMLYCSYHGDAPYILVKYGESDRKAANAIVNGLIARQFRVSYSDSDTVQIAEAEHLAQRMLSSGLVVFLISAEAQESRAFRNAIHFAQSRKKEVFLYLSGR